MSIQKSGCVWHMTNFVCKTFSSISCQKWNKREINWHSLKTRDKSPFRGKFGCLVRELQTHFWAFHCRLKKIFILLDIWLLLTLQWKNVSIETNIDYVTHLLRFAWFVHRVSWKNVSQGWGYIRRYSAYKKKWNYLLLISSTLFHLFN